MKKVLERFRRATWIYHQGLTKKPSEESNPVSDLFLWRNSADWKTYFELVDIAGLFLDDTGENSKRYVTLFFFDNSGLLFHKEKIDLVQNERRTLDLSKFTAKSDSSFGTFCIFHSFTPNEISELGSFIAERGYVSYSYKDSSFRAYVHGNLDAISYTHEKDLQMLGSRSFMPREYRLQYELQGDAKYEVGVVNSSNKSLSVSCYSISTQGGDVIQLQKSKIQSKGSSVFTIKVKKSQSCRIIIKSGLVMARPLVFRTHQNKLDVFHG